MSAENLNKDSAETEEVLSNSAALEKLEEQDVIGTPKKKKKREKKPPDPTDPAYIAAIAAVHTAKLEAEAAAIAAEEEANIPTPMENCRYYTSLGTFINHVDNALVFFWTQNSYLGSFLVHFWSIFDPFFVHHSSIFGPFSVHFRFISRPFLVHF